MDLVLFALIACACTLALFLTLTTTRVTQISTMLRSIEVVAVGATVAACLVPTTTLALGVLAVAGLLCGRVVALVDASIFTLFYRTTPGFGAAQRGVILCKWGGYVGGVSAGIALVQAIA